MYTRWRFKQNASVSVKVAELQKGEPGLTAGAHCLSPTRLLLSQSFIWSTVAFVFANGPQSVCLLWKQLPCLETPWSLCKCRNVACYIVSLKVDSGWVLNKILAHLIANLQHSNVLQTREIDR